MFSLCLKEVVFRCCRVRTCVGDGQRQVVPVWQPLVPPAPPFTPPNPLPHPAGPLPQVRKVVAREAANVNQLGMKLAKHSLYYKVTNLFGAAKRAMIRGDFEPRVDPGVLRCFERLAWLQRPPALKGHPIDKDLLN